MKTIGLLSLLTLTLGCSTEQVDSQEVKATITSFSIPVAACMGGYEIETPSGNYRINNLPPDYPISIMRGLAILPLCGSDTKRPQRGSALILGLALT